MSHKIDNVYSLKRVSEYEHSRAGSLKIGQRSTQPEHWEFPAAASIGKAKSKKISNQAYDGMAVATRSGSSHNGFQRRQFRVRAAIHLTSTPIMSQNHAQGDSGHLRLYRRTGASCQPMRIAITRFFSSTKVHRRAYAAALAIHRVQTMLSVEDPRVFSASVVIDDGIRGHVYDITARWRCRLHLNYAVDEYQIHLHHPSSCTK